MRKSRIKISPCHPQADYSSLGTLLQLKWKYLQRNVPKVGNLMAPIETAPRGAF